MTCEIQSVQIAKETSIKRVTVKQQQKKCTGEKAKCVAIKSFTNTSERSKDQSIPSHKKLFGDIEDVNHSNQREWWKFHFLPISSSFETVSLVLC